MKAPLPWHERAADSLVKHFRGIGRSKVNVVVGEVQVKSGASKLQVHSPKHDAEAVITFHASSPNNISLVTLTSAIDSNMPEQVTAALHLHRKGYWFPTLENATRGFTTRQLLHIATLVGPIERVVARHDPEFAKALLRVKPGSR
jgi:hypothetical protein